MPTSEMSASFQSFANRTITSPIDGQALLQHVPRELRHGGLDALDVGRDVAHQRARRVARQERRRLVEDVVVERVAQVGDRALSGGRHHGGRQVRAQPLQRVERDDRQPDRPHRHVADEDLVEDGLDHVRQAGAGRRIPGGRHPRQHEQPAVRPRVREQAAEPAHLAAEALRTRAEASARLGGRAPAGARRVGKRCGGGQRYDLISLRRHALAYVAGPGSIAGAGRKRQTERPSISVGGWSGGCRKRIPSMNRGRRPCRAAFRGGRRG